MRLEEIHRANKMTTLGEIIAHIDDLAQKPYFVHEKKDTEGEFSGFFGSLEGLRYLERQRFLYKCTNNLQK